MSAQAKAAEGTFGRRPWPRMPRRDRFAARGRLISVLRGARRAGTQSAKPEAERRPSHEYVPKQLGLCALWACSGQRGSAATRAAAERVEPRTPRSNKPKVRDPDAPMPASRTTGAMTPASRTRSAAEQIARVALRARARMRQHWRGQNFLVVARLPRAHPERLERRSERAASAPAA